MSFNELGGTAPPPMEICFEKLKNEQDSNQVMPDEEERTKILSYILEFAAAEASTEMCRAIGLELTNWSVQDPVTLKAMNLLDAIKTSGGFTDIEHHYEEFVSVVVDYETTTRRSSPVLNEIKSVLLCEFKVQICLGKFIGPRKVDAHLLNTVNIKALEDAIFKYFPEMMDKMGSFGEAAHLLAADTLTKLFNFASELEALKPNRSDEREAQLVDMVNAILIKHDWEKFLQVFRMFISHLLYTVCETPALLLAARGYPLPQTQRNLDPSRKVKRSAKFNALQRVYKFCGGTMSGWNSIINKTENEGLETLKRVLHKADEFRPVRETREKRKEEALEDEDEEDDINVSDDDFDDEQVYVAEEDFESEEDDPRHEEFPVQPGSTFKVKKAKRKMSFQMPSKKEYEELINFDKYSASSQLKKRRKKPIPWSQEETECLIRGVELFGTGQWAKILNHFHDVFSKTNRSSVSLKDRYRNLEIRRGREEAKERTMNIGL